MLTVGDGTFDVRYAIIGRAHNVNNDLDFGSVPYLLHEKNSNLINYSTDTDLILGPRR